MVGLKVDIVRFIPPYIHVLNMNHLYIIPFVCAVQTAEHNSAHLKWKIKSCQTIASNLLLHTMQWQFIATKKSPLSDSSLHSFQNPYTASLFQRRKYIFIDLLSTVEELPLWKALRTWVHNILHIEAVDHCSARCSTSITLLTSHSSAVSVAFKFHLPQKLFWWWRWRFYQGHVSCPSIIPKTFKQSWQCELYWSLGSEERQNLGEFHIKVRPI